MENVKIAYIFGSLYHSYNYIKEFDITKKILEAHGDDKLQRDGDPKVRRM